ncbi:MAG: hypothetical protein OS112_03800 [Methanoregula sp.]|nr:MAG: hypothetical protein OS112_03800 [Methanoregula sp.]
MTRGRPPLVALKEAYLIAMKRGQVMPVSEGRCDHFHFILFTDDRITFVKVKRMLSDMSDPKEILYNYEREIRHLARVPLNAVDAREFWVRSPRGTFHFFLVGKERIFRLQADGSIMTGIDYPLELPQQKEAPAFPAGKIPAGTPAQVLAEGKGHAAPHAADQVPETPAGKDPAGTPAPALPVAEKHPVPEQAPAAG